MVRRGLTVALALVALAGSLSVPAGAAGVDVAKWQRRLNVLHCNAGPVDGRTGTWTRSAVIRFQSRHGLAQNGRFNATTRTRLFASTAKRCDLRPVPRSGAGRRIVVSQRQNWVWLVDAHHRVVAQGGMVDNPGELRRGRYRTGSYCGRGARIRKNTSGSLWLDNFVRFAPCGFGFHRIPRAKSNGRQIHADHILGTNLSRSHGCLRVSSVMSRRLWNFTAAGRTVVRVL